MLWGATKAAAGRLPRWSARYPQLPSFEAELAQVDLAESCASGRSLSLQRAVDVALGFVEEELTAVANLGARESAAAEMPPGIAQDTVTTGSPRPRSGRGRQ